MQLGGRHCRGGGGGGQRGETAIARINADFPCAQNILKRVEERSERECTASDAHRELELVSELPLPLFPGKPFPRLDSPCWSCTTYVSESLESADAFSYLLLQSRKVTGSKQQARRGPGRVACPASQGRRVPPVDSNAARQSALTVTSAATHRPVLLGSRLPGAAGPCLFPVSSLLVLSPDVAPPQAPTSMPRPVPHPSSCASPISVGGLGALPSPGLSLPTCGEATPAPDAARWGPCGRRQRARVFPRARPTWRLLLSKR